MGWMLPSMCLLVPLKMGQQQLLQVAAGCPTHLRNYQTASWKVLETPWSSRTKWWICFVDKLCVYDTCVHPLRRAFICSIHVTHRCTKRLCKHFAQQKASVPPAKHRGVCICSHHVFQELSAVSKVCSALPAYPAPDYMASICLKNASWLRQAECHLRRVRGQEEGSNHIHFSCM